jgi:hypothetical protein
MASSLEEDARSGQLPVNPSNVSRIRLGVLAFPISGVIAALGALAPGINVNPAVDPAGFARVANYVALVNLAGIVISIFLLFGFQALYGFLAESSVDKWAFTGMILSIAGVALFLPFLGIIAFASPAAARLYLSGQDKAISIISESTSVSNPTSLIFGGFSVLSYVIGSILFSIAIWRSGRLPKWSAVPYAISAPLNFIPHYIPAIWFLGGLLLFVAGIGIAREIWKSST